MKHLLLIMNPAAGTKKANPHLPEILSVFARAGYECVVWMTRKRGDGTALAAQYGAQADLIVCIGGDGTFNEVISGVVRAGIQTPIGYIPAGSTNDFAASLGLPKNVIRAAQSIAAGFRCRKLPRPLFHLCCLLRRLYQNLLRHPSER